MKDNNDLANKKTSKLEDKIKWLTLITGGIAKLSHFLISSDSSLTEISNIVLNLAKTMTQSAHGYVSSIDPLTGNNIGHTLTMMMGNECKLRESGNVFPIGAKKQYHGLWGHALNTHQAFFTNCPAEHPAACGLPVGHVSLSNFLTVPAMIDNQLLGQISLANAPRPYTDKDLASVKQLAELYALAIHKKREEADFKIAKEAAEVANKTKSQFLANISHEIRTPLNGVIGMTELLLDTPLNNTQKDYVYTIKNSSHLLLRLINDILDLSKIEAGKLNLQFSSFKLLPLLNDTIRLFRHRVTEKKLNLITQFSSQLDLNLYGDPVRLQQVLLNLINNAIKFTDQGSITVSAQLQAKTSSNVAVHFFVADSGIGLSPNTIKKLFKPFVQADSSTTRKHGGTGLGLYISKQLVEMMKGKIGIESQLDKGCKIWFNLPFNISNPEVEDKGQIFPIKINKSSNYSSDTNMNLRKWENKLILLAEDNDTNREVVGIMLKKAGISHHAVSNGVETLEAVLKEDYDLILMDCQMPIMDGFETTKQIRLLDDPKKSQLPIIAVTAYALQEELDNCLHCGMNDCLTKPFTIADLMSILSKWLSINLSATDQVPNIDSSEKHLPEILDLQAINDLKKLSQGEEKDFVNRLIDIYLQETDPKMFTLQTALVNKDLNTIKFVAHSMISSSARLGAQRLSHLCRELERIIGKKINVPTVLFQAKTVEKEYLLVREALMQLNQRPT